MRADKWPGTILFSEQATVYAYRVSAELAGPVSELESHLFGWLHPDAPEDPCFCRSDGEPFLVTTSHERDAYLLLTNREHAFLAQEFPTLAGLLRKE